MVNMFEGGQSLEGEQKNESELRREEILLNDEPLSFEEVQKLVHFERLNTWPSEEKLREYLNGKPEETRRDIVAHKAEIEEQGSNIDDMHKNIERFVVFKRFEVKELGSLKHWGKIKNYLEINNINSDGIKVVVIDNEEYWKTFFGSNNSKSEVEPKTIILKKKIFESENIDDENLSWIVHEVGHVAFYDFLDDKASEYISKVHERKKYIRTAMESVAFQMQIGYLKSIGKTKEACWAFMKLYIEESFGLDESLDDTQKALKQNELEQLMQYVNNVFGQ